MDSTNNQHNEARRSRKKVDSCFSKRTLSKDVLHPLIRIGGIYLEKFGFNIGDEIDVSCENGKIIIQKVQPDAGVVKRKKTS